MDQPPLTPGESHPSQPQYASLRNSRHRPSPKGEQRLWLYQCAVRPCSRGDLKIAGTSRPKGKEIPGCAFCGGKMHWKGTERDTGGYPTLAEIQAGGYGVIRASPEGNGDGGNGSASPQSRASAPVAMMALGTSQQHATSHGMAEGYGGNGAAPRPHTATSSNLAEQPIEAGPSNSLHHSSSSVDNRGGRPWEL